MSKSDYVLILQAPKDTDTTLFSASVNHEESVTIRYLGEGWTRPNQVASKLVDTGDGYEITFTRHGKKKTVKIDYREMEQIRLLGNLINDTKLIKAKVLND